MSFNIIKDDGLFTLVMTESVDINETDLIRSKINDQVTDDMPIIINASDVTYIDSSGVALLLYLKKISENKGVSFNIATASEAVQKVIKLAMLENLLPIDSVTTSEEGSAAVSMASFDDDLSESFSDIFDEPKDSSADATSKATDKEEAKSSDDIFGNAGSDFK